MNIIINFFRLLLGLIYNLMKLLPVDNKILFISRQSNSPSEDINALCKKIVQEHPNYKTAILCRTINPGLYEKIKYCFHMIYQMYHLSTSKVVILDSYSILVSLLNHRKCLLIIQMWHSVGTMKKFGYSTLNKAEGTSSKIAIPMRMHKNYDYILCAGEGYRNHLAEGFNYPSNKIIILPLPRIALLQDSTYIKSKQDKIYSLYPNLKSKKNILYVPTFRKNKSEQEEFKKAIDSIKSAFICYSQNYNLIIKTHPLSDIVSDYTEFTSFDLLSIADYVISDYSCIVYEAAVLHIPLFFYAYDYENYINTRDLYMDYPNEIPGPMYSNAFDLLYDIKNNNFNMESQERFLSKYVSYKRNDIIGDIVSFIWSHITD